MATTDFDDEPFTDAPEHIPHFGWDALANMSPAYFGMVMATGVVSIAANQSGMDTLARWLFFINIAFYVTLMVLAVLRAVHAPRRVLFDLTHHRRAPSFFTRSEEHTSELQSLMRISYAVFRLKKTKNYFNLKQHNITLQSTNIKYTNITH